MDLASIVNYERDFPLELIKPDTVGSKRPQKLGITLMIRHIDCEAATEVARKRQAASILDDDSGVDSQVEIYAACISGWKGEITVEGVGLTYTPENALKLLSHPNLKWVFAQVRAAALKIGNFTGA